MKFTSLPVNVGDSFLLTTNDKVILVDGGKNKKHILTLLQQENIPDNHIDLLVCSHYDADHINGIIGILKSQKYSFDEIWLPEILGSIGYTLSKRIGNLFNDIRENRLDIHDILMANGSIFEKYESKEIEGVSNNKSFEQIDSRMLEEFINGRIYGFPEYTLRTNRYSRTPSFKITSTAKSIANLISYSLNSKAYIRWFKYKEPCIPKTYGFDMFCQNAVQTDISLFDDTLLLMALYTIALSKINKYGLVFMHKKDQYPNILFTGDSDLSFYKNVHVRLNNHSIITAPHHGSDTNDLAYSKIRGNDLIYVRSDQRQITRPGRGYTSNKMRYCTICRNITPKQKVELTFNGIKFITNAKACVC